PRCVTSPYPLPAPTLTPPLFYTATSAPAICTLSLHDALPICSTAPVLGGWTTSYGSGDVIPAAWLVHDLRTTTAPDLLRHPGDRSEEHTSELQSREKLVCRLLLEKKKCSPMTHT